MAMNNSTDNTEGLDNVLDTFQDDFSHQFSRDLYYPEVREKAKQSILKWISDNVIGKHQHVDHLSSFGDKSIKPHFRNELRDEMLEILKAHGYKESK